MSQLGIQELKDVVRMGLAVGNLIDALADGIGISDLKALWKAGISVPAGVRAVKSGLLIPQVKDLQPEEKADLEAMVREEFDLKNDGLEQAIEDAIATAIQIV